MHVGVRVQSVMFFYRQDLPEGQLCRYCFFTHRPIFGFFAPQGRHVAPIKVKFDREDRRSLLPAKFHLDRFRGVGLRPPTKKIWNVTNIIAPRGGSPYDSLKHFTGFMCLHKSAKFGCFISINDKIINNLPRWGRFQPNFRWLRQLHWLPVLQRIVFKIACLTFKAHTHTLQARHTYTYLNGRLIPRAVIRKPPALQLFLC